MIKTLFQRIVDKKTNLFIGAGCSIIAGAPTGAELARILFDNLPESNKKKLGQPLALPEMAQEYENVFDREELVGLLLNIYNIDSINKDFHEKLNRIALWNTIMTTNYDCFIENSMRLGTYSLIISKNDIVQLNNQRKHIFKIHGDINHSKNLIITKNDYERLLHDINDNNNIGLWTVIKTELLCKTTIFLGYSLNDNNIKDILDKIRRSTGDVNKTKYLIAPGWNVEQIAEIERMKVKYIDMDCIKFINQLIDYVHPPKKELNPVNLKLSSYKSKEEEKKNEPRLRKKHLNNIINSKLPIYEPNLNEFEELRKKTSIAIVTTNDIERCVLYDYLMPIPQFKAITKVNASNHTYYIGRFGRYNVLHIHVNTLYSPVDALKNSISEAFNLFKSIKYCINGGSAQGLNPNEQKIGNVMISNSIYYSVKENISKMDSTLVPITCGPKLFDLFYNTNDWLYTWNRKNKSTILCGNIRSVELSPFNSAQKNFTTSSIACNNRVDFDISSTCNDFEKEWIFVKSIASLKANTQVGNSSMKASKASFSLIYHVLSSSNISQDIYSYSSEEIKSEHELWIIHAQVGSPLWVINQLRSLILSRFIADLSLYNEEGYNDIICNSVKKDLATLASEIEKLPKLLSSNHKLDSSFEVFLRNYELWNEAKGNSESEKRKRIRYLEKLKAIRKIIAEEIRLNQTNINYNSDLLDMNNILAAHQDLVRENPYVFPELAKAIKKISRKLSKDK